MVVVGESRYLVEIALVLTHLQTHCNEAALSLYLTLPPPKNTPEWPETSLHALTTQSATRSIEIRYGASLMSCSDHSTLSSDSAHLGGRSNLSCRPLLAYIAIAGVSLAVLSQSGSQSQGLYERLWCLRIAPAYKVILSGCSHP